MFLAIVFSLSSVSAFADVSGCQTILGDYKCDYEGETITLSVQPVSASELSVAIDDEGEVITVDGNVQRSTVSDDEYVATCDPKNGLNMIHAFKNRPSQTVSISPTSTGVIYSIPSKNVSLSCTK